MGILATDILIKSMLEAAILDLRKNSWLLDDIFGGMAPDPLTSADYGYKEVQAAKKWFLSNDFPVLLQWRVSDDVQVPCVSIAYKPSNEAQDRTSLADELGPAEDFPINTVINSTIKVFDHLTPSAYESETGLMTMPKGIETTGKMVSGQFLVSRVSGLAYEIKTVESQETFKIAENVEEDFTDAYVTPPSSLWNVQREATFLREGYSIGCHCQNNAGQTIWLWQIVAYSFLRYKEAYLESRGFEVSNLSFSALERNNDFPTENVFSKYIEIDGQIQADWIKYLAPKLHKTQGGILIADGPKAPPGTYNEQAWLMEADAEDLAQSFGVLGEDDD